MISIGTRRSVRCSPEGIERLQALTTTFMQLGGQQLQVNVHDEVPKVTRSRDADTWATLPWRRGRMGIEAGARVCNLA